MRYNVDFPFKVQFLDPEDITGDGLKTISERCVGTVRAANLKEAAEQVKQTIRSKYPVCWKMSFGTPVIEALP